MEATKYYNEDKSHKKTFVTSQKQVVNLRLEVS